MADRFSMMGDDQRPENGENYLQRLRVFDRLEVGPPVVEPKRIIATYALTRAGQTESTDLIYTYEENVFDPEEPESQNLAGMILAQVAINYGLFCREMVFHGIFDDIDRRFIKDMAENTAREIYVKKFLEHNPFLLEDLKKNPVVKQKSYMTAKLKFQHSVSMKKGTEWKLWQTSRNSHAILSSGGKDSLLSFALIRELNRDAHPIFVNESGRHWFTALNAYRYFKENISNTARVWVNSDRVFAWFLRRFPFIRKDFADIRSDDYPIRLWTVAVFLFGILPVVRKRKIGRILIGDEFDSTVKKQFEGITHYNGLYDQSIFFDYALSRYFMKKGWAISQFSALRPLSELLIEKILTERYPEFQQYQTSCHATHKEGERILPCGRCEKCRRIISMLIAIGADPVVCGYNRSQIEYCLRTFNQKGVSQDDTDAMHLAFILKQKGVIEESPFAKVKPKAHPETMKLRFDPKRSPIEAIPRDLRKELFKIMLHHAEGAVRRFGLKWEPFDPLSDNSDIAYPFEFEAFAGQADPRQRHQSGSDHRIFWGEYSWPELELKLKTMDVAILPVGAIEQHGPHLPVDTDTFDAEYLAKCVAEACGNPKPLVLPTVSYGVSYHHEDFAGTISINNQTLAALVYDIGMSAARNGIKKLVIINGHGGNSPTLNYAAQMINRDAHIFVCVDTGETSDVDINSFIETPNDVHAGEIETSTSLAVRPHLVKTDLFHASVPEFSSRYLNFTSRRGVLWYAFTHRISLNGVMGDPTKADAEKGKKIWEIMIAHLVTLVEDLKKMSLDEIHHRNY
jgi:creatinine amidohydrolase/Fe(II)-dependent formamide hydrolase-like protein